MNTTASSSSAFLPMALIFGLLLFSPLSAEELILDNGGLKNTYRLVFTEISPKHKIVRGALEILGDEDGRKKAHTRIPFSGTIHPAEEKGGAEALVLHVNLLVAFYPPRDAALSSPAVTGTFYGRGTQSPGATLRLWSFDRKSNKWLPTEMTFGKVPPKSP